jgi:hypothetical protein
MAIFGAITDTRTIAALSSTRLNGIVPPMPAMKSSGQDLQCHHAQVVQRRSAVTSGTSVPSRCSRHPQARELRRCSRAQDRTGTR